LLVVTTLKKIPGTLGVLVSSDKHLTHVVNLTRAAHAKGKKVHIFFTGSGVTLTLCPEFKQLVGRATLSICDVSFRSFGLHGREAEVPGIAFKDFATQAKNAELVQTMERYIVF
jgi:hypothetical protein